MQNAQNEQSLVQEFKSGGVVENYQWTLAKLVANTAFSLLGTWLMQILFDHSLFMTHTKQVGTEVFQLALFQIINFFAVPVCAHSFGLVGRRSGIAAGTLWCAFFLSPIQHLFRQFSSVQSS
jgi:hypothetical protein